MLKVRKAQGFARHSRHQSFWKRQGRYLYLRFVRMREHPKVIARGLAVGVFAGSFPLFGLQTIIGIILAFLVRGSKLAAAAGTWVSNPLTYVPLFAFNYKIGQSLLGQSADKVNLAQFNQNWDSWSQLAELGVDFTVTLFYGCFTVGLIMSILAYFISLRIITKHRRR